MPGSYVNMSEKIYREFKQYAKEHDLPLSTAIRALAYKQLQYVQGKLNWQGKGTETANPAETKQGGRVRLNV